MYMESILQYADRIVKFDTSPKILFILNSLAFLIIRFLCKYSDYGLHFTEKAYSLTKCTHDFILCFQIYSKFDEQPLKLQL